MRRICDGAAALAAAGCMSMASHAAVVTLQWDANQETDIAGYRIYWGSVSRGTNTHPGQFLYEHRKEIPASKSGTTIRDVPLNQTNYITVTAFNIEGAESDYGFEIPYMARDADGDGMDDAWEVRCGLNTTLAGHAMKDEDGDGLSNYAEYIAGTDPKNRTSRLACSARMARTGCEVSWSGVAGRQYTLERSLDLKTLRPFRPIALLTAEQSGVMSYSDRAGLVGRFYMYRVRAQ